MGGSAANSSHAVNDFRKLCGIECYSPVDNVSELTARINDEGWNSSFSNWLNISNLNSKDALFIFSVGGGDLEKKVSVNLIEAVKFGKKKGAKKKGFPFYLFFCFPAAPDKILFSIFFVFPGAQAAIGLS